MIFSHRRRANRVGSSALLGWFGALLKYLFHERAEGRITIHGNKRIDRKSGRSLEGYVNVVQIVPFETERCVAKENQLRTTESALNESLPVYNNPLHPEVLIDNRDRSPPLFADNNE